MASRMCVDGKVRGKGREPTTEMDCLTPGCPRKFGGISNKKGGRGLCAYCHGVASRLVHKKKKTTWEELERLGLANPPYRSLFERAFKEAKKGKTDA